MTSTPFVSVSRSVIRSLVAVLVCALLPGGAAWGGLQPPLSKIPVPEPSNLNQFLLTLPDGVTIDPDARAAAIALGKALFWDMQVGSDGQTACATCHFRAGADVRLNNTVHPGADGIFSANTSSVPLGPVYTLNTTVTSTLYDFPFFQISPATSRVGVDTLFDPILNPTPAVIIRNIDEITGSQGITKTDFGSIVPGNAVEVGTPVSDPTFTANGNNLRQVTDRNAPSVINAVFNYTNFRDGRANNIFHGANPFGPASQNARIWRIPQGGGLPQQISVAIPNAALASLASGHPLNTVVMSYNGRTFPDLGQKMLSLTPLAQQVVDPSDSVLGTVSQSPAPGLTISYTNMIRNAFQDDLTTNQPTTGGFDQIQSNFSLFFGLSVQLYLATLVSDRTPFDRFQSGNLNALNDAAQQGLALFDNRCALCHAGTGFSSAVAGSPVLNDVPVSFTTNTDHRLIQQRLTLADVPAPVFFDTGFYNTGIRATAEDVGRGGTAPIVNTETGEEYPLSFTRLAKLQEQGQLLFETPILRPPSISPLVPLDQADVIQGSFKVPGLRNVELTAPYMHNGSIFTLDEVVEFYTRGGNLVSPTPPEVAIAPIRNLKGDPVRRLQIVEFLKSLTDDRVENDWAPFDHPALAIPNGGDPIALAATGGIPTVLPTLTFNPLITPTIQTTLLTGGTVTDDSLLTDKVTVAVQINNLEPVAAIVTGTTWSHTITGLTTIGTNTITAIATHVTGGESTLSQAILLLPAATIAGAPALASNQTGATLTIGGNGVATYQFSVDGGAFGGDIPVATPIVLSGLSEGLHAVAVLGKDISGTLQQPAATPTTAGWTVKSIPPVLTLHPVAAASGGNLTIGGTVELGLIPKVQVAGAVSIGPVTAVGGGGIAVWSCPITGLGKGLRTITVTATDIAANVTSQAATVKIIPPDGDFREIGTPGMIDVIKALRIAVGLDAPTLEDTLHGDVAPLVNGVPAPDGGIDVDDALAILKKVIGSVSF